MRSESSFCVFIFLWVFCHRLFFCNKSSFTILVSDRKLQVEEELLLIDGMHAILSASSGFVYWSFLGLRPLFLCVFTTAVINFHLRFPPRSPLHKLRWLSSMAVPLECFGTRALFSTRRAATVHISNCSLI